MDDLKRVMTEIDRELAALMPMVRDRVKRRVKAAYWIGVQDGRTLADTSPSAERRSESRLPAIDHSRSNAIIAAAMRR